MAVKSLCYCHLIHGWAISCLSLAWVLQSLRISSELIIYYGFCFEKWSRYLEIVGWSWPRWERWYVAGLWQTGCLRVWTITCSVWACVCWCLYLCICPDKRPSAVSSLPYSFEEGLFPEHGAHNCSSRLAASESQWLSCLFPRTPGVNVVHGPHPALM